VLFALALFCSFIAYLSFNCAFYVYVLGEVNEPQPTIGSIDWVRGLLAFVVVRAQNEPFIGGAQIGAVGNAIVWLIELAITQYTAHSRISQAVAIGRVESVPSEVTALVLHLLSAGQDTESVTRELTKRGWTNPEDQQRALQAVASLASLAEQASEEGEEGQ
jgi:hypothetical protein